MADKLGTQQHLAPRRLIDVSVADVSGGLLVSCSPDTPLAGVAHRMATFNVHAVVVFREPAAGGPRVPWSVISDLDVARAAASGEDPPAAVVASEPTVIVSGADSLVDAALAMGRLSVSHAIVVDPDTQHPTGIISALDVVRAFAAESFQ